MKVLIISHYLNFNIEKKRAYNIFPKLLINAINNAGMTYEICKFTKKEIHQGIKRGARFIFMFEEVNTKTASIFMEDKKPDAVVRMFKELSKIEKKIPIYPPTSLQNLVVSKRYLELLPHKTKLFMPDTKTFLFYKTTVVKSLTDVCSYFKRKHIYEIIIKFGYSGDSEHVFKFSIESLDNPFVINKLIDEMNDYRSKCGIPFLIIVQPFNNVINNRLNEYRCLFVGGEMSPIAAFGFNRDPVKNNRIFIPSNELNPDENIDHSEIITLAKYGYEIMSRYIGFAPPVLRVDVSWILENNIKRYYINEFEGLSGTYYFSIGYIPKEYGPFLITDEYECSKICRSYPPEIQLRLANSLVEYVKDHSPTI
jgi:hypothetical protein